MKITVKICAGTACYIMGGANLLNIKDALSKEELSKVNIEGSSCLGLCKGDNPKTPYAKVGNIIIEKANLEILTKTIREAISKQS